MRKQITAWFVLTVFLLSMSVLPIFAEGTKSVTIGVAEVLPMNSMVSLPTSPTGIKELKLVWTVSDSSVVKLDSSGRATGMRPGVATVTATVKNNPGLKTSFQVTVVNKVKGIAFFSATMTMRVGEKSNISYSITPSSEYKTPVVWSSSDASVAKVVAASGMVTALKAGTSTITAKTKDGDHTATCTLTVASTVTGIQVLEPAFSMEVGEKHQLQASVLPPEAVDKTILYQAFPKDIVRITPAGLVTGMKEGAATVGLTTKDGGFKGTVTITVVSDVDRVVVLDPGNSPISELTLKVGEACTVRAAKSPDAPESLKGYTLKWSSSNTAVARIGTNGAIKPLAPGTTTIRVEVNQDSASVSTSFPLTVASTVTGLELGKSEMSIAVGQSETMTCTVLPETAYDKTVKWTSSDTKILRVSRDKITGVGAGTVTLTATTEDGGFRKQCKVTVRSMTEGILLPDASIELPLGNTYNVTPIVMPATALIKTMDVSVSDKDGILSRKLSNGEFAITGLKPGDYKVTFTSTDGKKTAVLPIKVIPQDLDVTIKGSDGSVISKD